MSKNRFQRNIYHFVLSLKRFN